MASVHTCVCDFVVLYERQSAHCRGRLLLLSQQKKQKCFFYLGFFAAHGLCPAELAEPRAGKVYPFASHALACASAKYPYAPPAAQCHHCSARSRPKRNCESGKEKLSVVDLLKNNSVNSQNSFNGVALLSALNTQMRKIRDQDNHLTKSPNQTNQRFRQDALRIAADTGFVANACAV